MFADGVSLVGLFVRRVEAAAGERYDESVLKPIAPSHRAAALILVVAAAVGAALVHAPIAQDPAYHLFADTRSLGGLPNIADVLSNLPFLIVGVFGLSRTPLMNRPAYTTLCAGILLVSLGSAYYHWSPSNATLLWDRLPMTVAFMALFSMLLEERVLSVKALAPLIALGIASAFYWAWTDDLRPYILVQFLPILLMPVILLLYPKKYLSGGWLMGAVLFYAAAKACETYDREMLAALAVMSGHTIKHLAAGIASLCIILSVPVKEV
jgi:hypothetical protein